MAEISAALVKQLREMTGAGLMDCKSALSEAGGSLDKAVEVLRKKGMKDIGKRSGKIAAEGTIGVYAHPGDQVVALVELNCETDFVARNQEFRTLARDLAMQVAAMRPAYVSMESVPAGVLEKEKEILLEQLDEKQRAKAQQILPGKLEKFYQETVLLNQLFVKDDTGRKTVRDMLDDLQIKMGEKLSVRRFERFEVGEGIEKRSGDFVAEVAALTAG